MTEVSAGTLTDFLLARLAEDYEVAWAAEPSPWREGGWAGDVAPDAPRVVLEKHGDVTAHCFHGGTYGHVLRFDPTRVIADIEAKRQIVANYQQNYWPDPGDSALLAGTHGAAPAAEVIRLHAAVYADHPDYREEWRP